jgi:hypothetical protein
MHMSILCIFVWESALDKTHSGSGRFGAELRMDIVRDIVVLIQNRALPRVLWRVRNVVAAGAVGLHEAGMGRCCLL